MFNRASYFPIVNTEYCELYGQIIPSGKIFLHLNMKTQDWTKDLYKDMVYDFNKVVDEFKEKGIKYLWVLIPKDDKLLKFENLFGFENVMNVASAEDENEIQAYVLRRKVE